MKRIGVGLVVLSVLMALSGCSTVDVIATGAKDSFETFSTFYQDQIVKIDSPRGYTVVSPGNQRFYMSTAPEETSQDLVFIMEAAPFITAGLDVNQLSEGYAYDAVNNTLRLTSDLGDKSLALKGDEGIVEFFSALTDTYRERVGYHAKLDHFGIDLGGGNMFEWAKDMDTNDKDMVFVLDPKPLVEAGLDPGNVEGWVFAEVEVMDANQKPILVEKLLGVYNLK